MYRRLLAAVAAIAVAVTPRAANAGGLPDYPREADLLVDTPGTTNSIAGGLLNPANWAMRRGGLFLAWDDVSGDLSRDGYTGVLSFRNLGFGVRQFRFEPVAGDPYHVRDYVLGVSGGNRSGTLGLAYGWGGGDLEREPRHERLSFGAITRCRYVSLGADWTRDLEVNDNTLQADLGFRPLGPRVTLFGDAVYEHGQSFGDIATGYGAEVKVWPGLAVAAKARSTGEVSLRVNVAIDRNSDLSWRPHLDDGGNRLSSTYALEVGPTRSWLGQRSLGRGHDYPTIALQGRMAYQRYRLFDRRQTLLGVLRRIQAVADDPRAGGVVLDLSGAQIGAEMMWELREQLAALRAHGKKVVVYLDRSSMFQYMLASVADQIWMDPAGAIDVRGLATGRTYMRSALDKLGIGVDELRFFTYKSAFESFSRGTMSDPDREQRQSLVDDFYDEAAGDITAARGITRGQWDALVNDKGLLMPEEARAAGLVDSIGGFAQAQKAARAAPRRGNATGSAALLSGLTGDPVWGPEEWGEPPRIAVLYAIGPCEMESGIRGRTLSKAIRAAGRDWRVKAIVLRADSPGGDPLPSDLVAREIAAAAKKKPVIVSQGAVAGSGGYWISMYGDTIVASPLTITGSIGVIAGWVWNKQFGTKIGFDYDGVKRGDHSDLEQGIRLPLIDEVVPDRPLTSEERDRAETIIRTQYKEFVAKVARGRGLDEKYVDSIGQGRVWSGTRGKEKGLVDEMGGLWRSLQIAKSAARLGAARPVQFAEGPDPGLVDTSWRPRLFGVETARALDATLGEPTAPLTGAERDYLRQVLRAPGRPLFMMEPFEIRDGASQP